MKYFKLPDLGEGLNEAEIVQWHVKEGEDVKVDQLMVSVETAKAIVDVPSPQAGTVAAIFAQIGDVIHLGEPLMEYAGVEDDSGTVVGSLSVNEQATGQDSFIVGSAHSSQGGGNTSVIKATPSVRALAKRLAVDISYINGSGPQGQISSEDVEKAAQLNLEKGHSEVLKGVRKSMARTMKLSHEKVVPVTLFDEVDVHLWKDEDTSMRLIHAMAVACETEPALNVWFDGEQLTRRLLKKVDLGIAVDTEQGLFVPVLRDIQSRSLPELRNGLDDLRAAVKSRKIPPSEMQGATITLSNFGMLAGRFANPIVVPPMVAIVGAGGIRQDVLAHEGQAVVHPVLPLSLSFDHRAVTGGEAARFLKAMMDDLTKSSVE